jgi:hypothetical protein
MQVVEGHSCSSTARFGPAQAIAVDVVAALCCYISRIKDRFRVRECYLSFMLSYLCPELLYMVDARPLVSVAVGRDRY